MANSRRDKEYLGIDSSVLVAYLTPDHPDHPRTKSLARRFHAINPTVLHETYHACVFKLRRKPEQTVRSLLGYMNHALCLQISANTVKLGLNLALTHGLGGRDALILATYLLSKEVRVFVTLDKTLLSMGKINHGQRTLEVSSPANLA